MLNFLLSQLPIPSGLITSSVVDLFRKTKTSRPGRVFYPTPKDYVGLQPLKPETAIESEKKQCLKGLENWICQLKDTRSLCLPQSQERVCS